ncbi:MAG: biotin--[acetyl-CoA-carboxylase] ligase [Balneola sp.]|nr:biotin--[acetyl-CoA-carboxylase] ligase [Balneola sp.]MBE78154.1 biotin--[acetyl-CoA-carboxylase] ligase [Balneola sp.]HBX65533.1 biotin--[acetyl-CoA-carboxylase] ligase [Balneolaceae bacterium]
MFNPELFEKHVATSWLGRSFYFFKELPSTNSYAKQMDSSAPHHGSLVVADHQTGGRGQYERKWQVEPGQNLTFSLVFEPLKGERFTLLTLACALAVSDVIDAQADISTKLKWPNDILCDGKKLCGILTETQFSGSKVERVVVGIGLNVNQKCFEGELKEKATSLSKESSGSFCREELLAEVVQKIEYYYRLWNQFSPDLVKHINRKMIGFGEWTNLIVNNEELEGEYKFLGVNDAGALLALDKDFDVKTFAYEQVRVRF